MILADNIKMVKKTAKDLLLFTMYLHKGLFCMYNALYNGIIRCVYDMKTESHEIIPFPFILNCLFCSNVPYDITKQNVMGMKVNRSEIECMEDELSNVFEVFPLRNS